MSFNILGNKYIVDSVLDLGATSFNAEYLIRFVLALGFSMCKVSGLGLVCSEDCSGK